MHIFMVEKIMNNIKFVSVCCLSHLVAWFPLAVSW